MTKRCLDDLSKQIYTDIFRHSAHASRALRDAHVRRRHHHQTRRPYRSVGEPVEDAGRVEFVRSSIARPSHLCLSDDLSDDGQSSTGPAGDRGQRAFWPPSATLWRRARSDVCYDATVEHSSRRSRYISPERIRFLVGPV